jgi:hypothetical protein
LARDALELVDLMHVFFPHLEEVRVYVRRGLVEHTPGCSLEEEKGFATKKKVISLNSYAKEKRGKTVGVGFECIWLSKEGKKRSFLMQGSWSGGWYPRDLGLTR